MCSMNNSNSLSLIQGPSTVTCTIATYPHNFPMDFISSLSFRMLQELQKIYKIILKTLNNSVALNKPLVLFGRIFRG
jgi:hypothetical protein